MTYKETVLRDLRDYPSIFPNRFSVDNHLFLTIGNGYEWKDGELIPCGNEGKLDKLSNKEIKELYEKYKSQYDDYTIETSDKFFLDSLRKTRADKEWHYHVIVSKYSEIMEIPDDIKQDWLYAIKVCIDFVLLHKDDLLDTIHADKEEQIELLNKSKERIEQLISVNY